jgi:hypothetical protein
MRPSHPVSSAQDLRASLLSPAPDPTAGTRNQKTPGSARALLAGYDLHRPARPSSEKNQVVVESGDTRYAGYYRRSRSWGF